MNAKGNYKKGNRIKILEALYVGGCLPYSCLGLFSGDVRLVQRKALKMQREGLVNIKQSKNGNGKILELNDWRHTIEAYAEYINDLLIERAEEIEKTRWDSYSDEGKEKRLLRLAELYLIMHQSEIGSYPYEKIDLNDVSMKVETEEKQYFDSIEIKNYTGYAAQVVKEINGKKKVIWSRICGLAVTPGGIYATYNIANKLIEWNKNGEIRIISHLKQIVREKCNRVEAENINCIILGKDMKIFGRVLTQEEPAWVSKNNKSARKTLINIDMVYDAMYGVPSTKDGIEMLKIMSEPRWEELMESQILRGKEKRICKITNDAYTEEEGYILLFCNGNLTRLKSFLTKANYNVDEKFCIYCFDFQYEIFETIELPENVNIKTIELAAYVQREGEVRNEYIKQNKDIRKAYPR